MARIAATAVVLLVLPATARATTTTVYRIEHGTSALLFVKAHPRAGTARSRAHLRARGLWLVRSGLRLAGVLPGFHCIQGHEASWHGDSNPKYDGGLQMDDPFQRSYGARFRALWGSADRWPVWAQLVTGFRAYRVRGWTPWPNTARVCGLL